MRLRLLFLRFLGRSAQDVLEEEEEEEALLVLRSPSDVPAIPSKEDDAMDEVASSIMPTTRREEHK